MGDAFTVRMMLGDETLAEIECQPGCRVEGRQDERGYWFIVRTERDGSDVEVCRVRAAAPSAATLSPS